MQSRLELVIDSTTGERRLKSLNRQLGATERAGNLAAKSVKLAAGGVAALSAAAAGGAVALYAMTRAGMNAIDEQAKLARQLDSTIGGVRGLQLAANDAGVSTGVLNSSMEQLSARLGEAARGSGQALEMLNRIGLRAEELAGLDVDERVARIADRVTELGLSGAETADVLRQFGIRNRELVNLLRQGGDPIREARQEIEDYGLAISSIDAATIEAANDALSRASLVTESLRSALAVELSPYILEVASRFNEMARETGGWGNVVKQSVEWSLAGLATVADGIQEVRLANAAVERGVAEMDLAFSQFVERAWTSFSNLVDGMIGGINSTIEAWNALTGADIGTASMFRDSGFMERIRAQTDAATQAAWDARRAYVELAESPSMSSRLEEFLESIEKRRQQIIDQAENGGLSIDPPGLPGLGDGESLKEFASSFQSLYDRLRPVEAAQRKYREEQEILTEAHRRAGEMLKAKLITEEQYNGILSEQAILLRQLADAQLSTQTPGQAYGGIGFGSQIGDPVSGMGVGQDNEASYWDRWLESAETALTDFDQLAANTAENFQRGFGNAFEAMVFDSQSLGEAMHNLTDGIARSMVNALGQMAGQWLAYQAVQLAVGKSSEAAAIAGATVAGSSIAAAYAPAAAAASLATSGANSAPAMAGMASTYALSKTMALAGMAHDGIDSVPREGTWLLDKGERVVSSSLNRDLTQFLESEKQSDKQGVTITYAPVIQVEAAPGASMADAKRLGQGLDAYITTKFYRMVEKEKRPGGALYR